LNTLYRLQNYGLVYKRVRGDPWVEVRDNDQCARERPKPVKLWNPKAIGSGQLAINAMKRGSPLDALLHLLPRLSRADIKMEPPTQVNVAT